MPEKNPQRFAIITLGCPKNLVDSEVLQGELQRSGFKATQDAQQADVIIINTCGFILPAREESIETILNALDWKQSQDGRKVFVVGCLAERSAAELRRELPEVDFIAGVESHTEVIRQLTGNTISAAAPEKIRSLLSPPHYAYLKIAEGCDNQCSFCSIPSIRGKQRSRSIRSLMDEALYLQTAGVQELILISQDLTRYGFDLPGKPRLSELLDEILRLELFPWVRILYTNPDFWQPELLPLFRKYPQLCPYLDIPVQHASDRVLQSMHRKSKAEYLRRLLRGIREEVPGIALRTSVMVGYPGETETDFDALLDLIEEIRFERLGVFGYSAEEGTAAFALHDSVTPSQKEERMEIVTQLQWDISREFAERQLKRDLTVMIDELQEGQYVGRTVWDAPEIDCQVRVESGQALIPGRRYRVTISAVDDLDLIGTVKEAV